MTVAVGEGSPFHVAYDTEGAWLHATGEELGNLAVTSDGAAAYARAYSWFRVSVPVLNPEAVLSTAGTAARSCVTAACSAFIAGW
jgi:hypothetical protein